MTNPLLTIPLSEWTNKCNEVDAKQAEIDELKAENKMLRKTNERLTSWLQAKEGE